MGQAIKIQQDNARPHARIDDDTVVQAGKADGWNITLMCQLPNSPDFNVLDLGYFNAIQSLQHQQNPRNIDELIAAVEKSFQDLATDKLNKCLLVFADGNAELHAKWRRKRVQTRSHEQGQTNERGPTSSLNNL